MKFECDNETRVSATSVIATGLLEDDVLAGVQGGITLGGLALVRHQGAFGGEGIDCWDPEILRGPLDQPAVGEDRISNVSPFGPNNEDRSPDGRGLLTTPQPPAIELDPNQPAPIENAPIEPDPIEPDPIENVALEPKPVDIDANEPKPNEAIAIAPDPIEIDANNPAGTAPIPNGALGVQGPPNGALAVYTPNGSFGVSQEDYDHAINTQSFSIQSFGDPHIQAMVDGVARQQIDYGPAIEDLLTMNNTVGGPTSISTHTYNLSGDQHITVNKDVTIESGPIGGAPGTGYSINVAMDGTVTMTDANGTRSVNTAGAPTTVQVGNATVTTTFDHVVVEQTLLDGGKVVTEFDIHRGVDNIGNSVDFETKAVGNAGLGGWILDDHHGDSFAAFAGANYDPNAVVDRSTTVPVIAA